jgi:hypothetical protein
MDGPGQRARQLGVELADAGVAVRVSPTTFVVAPARSGKTLVLIQLPNGC